MVVYEGIFENVKNVFIFIHCLKKGKASKTGKATCIVDLDFYDHKILSQLQKIEAKYPTIKLISHSDIDNEKVGKALLDIGFFSCLLVGSGVDDFKKSIGKTVNG